MKYERFEDLPVWKTALNLALRIYALTRDRFFSQSGDLRDQIRRAALSVSNNIAEGFERGSTAELLAFLYIARGSAGEVRSMLRFMDQYSFVGQSPGANDSRSEIPNPKPEISNLKSEISDLISLAESCSRQIRAWANSLQNSDIKGQRHLNDQTRKHYENRKDAEAFEHDLAKTLHQAQPGVYPDPDVKK